MQKFAVFDIDGTLIRWQLFHAIVHHLGKNNYISQNSHQKIKRARMIWKNRDLDDAFKIYEKTLVEAYLEALPSVNPADYHRIVEAVFDEYKDQLFVYTRDLLKKLKQHDYYLIAISGSHEEIVRKFADYHGFDYAVGAVFKQKNGKFTGQVTTPIFNKQDILKDIIKQQNLTLNGSVGVGDTASDISMLELVAKPIAYNPSRGLYQAAKQNKWPIVSERKDVIYQLIYNGKDYVLGEVKIV